MVMSLLQQRLRKHENEHIMPITGLRSRENAPSVNSYSPHSDTSYIDAPRIIELTREKGFVDGDADIFDILEQKLNEATAAQRSLGATIALLKRSSQMLKDAEDKIEAQDERLKTLQRLATRDEVSGLLNRRGFINLLHKEVSRTQRGLNDGGLLVIFNFENLGFIRSQFGKDAADQAVELIAKAMENEIRVSDHAGRLLDDEFVLLLTDTSMEQSLSRLQHLAVRLNKLSLIHKGEEINFNLSLGLKSFDNNDRALDIFEAASDDLKRNRSTKNGVK